MRRVWKSLKDNRGSAMVVVIVIVAFISILIATMFSLSVMNIRMKDVDRKAKGNFYSAEGALEQISLGLQNEISNASRSAYVEVMKNYAGKTSATDRRTLFNGKFLTNLEKALEGTAGTGKYDAAVLAGYLSTEVEACTDLTASLGTVNATAADSLVLKDVVVKYKDAQGYETVIQTDIRLTAPDMNLISSSDTPDLFDYTIIADKGLKGIGSPTVNANVYAGKGKLTDQTGMDIPDTGMFLSTNSKWKFTDAKRLVVDGNVEIIGGADLTAETDIDFWANEIRLSGMKSSLNTKGRTFVANDLLIQGNNDTVTIGGEYYGYGDLRSYTTPGGAVLSDGSDSSAILINGHNTKLDMLNVRKLLVAGSAQITTTSSGFSGPGGDEVIMHPENDPSWEELPKSPAVLAQGAYTIQSVSEVKLVQSNAGCLLADQNLLGQDASGHDIVPTDAFHPELRFILVTNADGTISFLDRIQKKYLTLSNDSSGMLTPAAEAIGPSEKFYAYTIQGMVGNVVLKSYSTNKYVTVEPSIGLNDGSIKTNLLCANRDKITDSSQLFILKMCGEKIIVPPQPEQPITSNDQLVTFTYSNSSNYVASLSIPEWAENTSNDDAQAWIYYEDPWGGARFAVMPLRNGGKRSICKFNFGSGHDYIPYMIYYTVHGKLPANVAAGIPANAVQAKAYMENLIANNQPNLKKLPFEGKFNEDRNQAKGNGNSEKVDGTFVPGVYTIKANSNGKFAGVGADGILRFNVNQAADSSSGYESSPFPDDGSDIQEVKFLFANNKDADGNPDGTFSIRSLTGDLKYLSVDANGMLSATATAIGPNERFTYVPLSVLQSGSDDNLIVLKSMPNSVLRGGYIAAQEGGTTTTKNRNEIVQGNTMYFQWISYRDTVTEVNPELPDPTYPSDVPYPKMYYLDEDSSEAFFDSMMWVKGQPVQMEYTIKYADTTKPDTVVPFAQPINFKTGPNGAKQVPIWQVDGLSHLDRVIYRFKYDYIDQKGEKQTNVLTPKYVYIHETEYGENITELAGSKDILLGESLEVKSNQVAYLVPPECLGTVNGEAVIGRNPMTTEEYVRLKNAEINGLAGFKMVDFDKESSLLGNKKLRSYVTSGNPDTDATLLDNIIKKVFIQTSEGTMVYFYVNFDSDKQSEYFRDYYAVNQDALQNYMHDYIVANGVQLKPNDFTRRTTDGNLLYSQNSNTILVSGNENFGANMTPAQKSSLENEIDGYRKSYRALTKKLVPDYSQLTSAEDADTESVFTNLIEAGRIALLTDNVPQTTTSTDGLGGTITAMVIDYPTGGTYVYNNGADPYGQIRIIITNGNVELDKDFSGIVIAGGTVTVNHGATYIQGNKADIQRLLNEQVADLTLGGVSTKPFVEYYFKDISALSLGESNPGMSPNGEYVPLNELVTYEEWSKN